jgi:hypothetical protein
MPEEKKPETPKLSERIENHRKEAQLLLKQGGEQPQYEFKRSVSLSRENLEDRLDFVKFVQAVANSEADDERCIVVGGDPEEKKFYPVTNPGEFDAANLSKIFTAYLEPVPSFHSYRVTTDEGEPFVLLVLDGNQRRPIVVIKQGQTEKGKNRLELGDIWVKKNTDTVRATRADIDSMYRVRSEAEAEDRARKRVAHLLELNSVTRAVRTAGIVLPSPQMIVGPREGLRTFAAELIATNDRPRFKMLLEMCRDTLVEEWDNAKPPDLAGELASFFSGLTDFRTNRFLPTLDSLTELGLLGIKHDVGREWLGPVVDLLVEAFSACQRLVRFEMYGNQSWWRPAFDVYVGIRVLANYVVLRRRLSFLGEILPHIVTRVTGDPFHTDVKVPVMLWPFASLNFGPDAFKGGRAAFLWKDRVATAWGNYFGNHEKFVTANTELELLLEFNSYLGTNQPADARLADMLVSTPVKRVEFGFIPDLWAQDLSTTVPMAEKIYEHLASEQGFPAEFTIDPRFRLFINAETKPRRLELYGRFLYELKVWQSKFRFDSLRLWGFTWDWPERLKKIVDAYGETLKAKRKQDS